MTEKPRANASSWFPASCKSHTRAHKSKSWKKCFFLLLKNLLVLLFPVFWANGSTDLHVQTQTEGGWLVAIASILCENKPNSAPGATGSTALPATLHPRSTLRPGLVTEIELFRKYSSNQKTKKQTNQFSWIMRCRWQLNVGFSKLILPITNFYQTKLIFTIRPKWPMLAFRHQVLMAPKIRGKTFSALWDSPLADGLTSLEGKTKSLEELMWARRTPGSGPFPPD